MVKRQPRRRRVAALQFMVQQDAAAQGQRQRQRIVSDFGGAVIRDVADEDVAACQRLAVELVVADPMRSALGFRLGPTSGEFRSRSFHHG